MKSKRGHVLEARSTKSETNPKYKIPMAETLLQVDICVYRRSSAVASPLRLKEVTFGLMIESAQICGEETDCRASLAMT
jgi:hypothetical protein